MEMELNLKVATSRAAGDPAGSIVCRVAAAAQARCRTGASTSSDTYAPSRSTMLSSATRFPRLAKKRFKNAASEQRTAILGREHFGKRNCFDYDFSY